MSIVSKLRKIVIEEKGVYIDRTGREIQYFFYCTVLEGLRKPKGSQEERLLI